MNLYVDSSALLAVLLGEQRGPEVLPWLAAPNRPFLSSLTIVETRRTLLRDGLEPGLASAWFATFGLVDVSPAAWERAGRPFPDGHIRTLDAVHLAVALDLAARLPDLGVLAVDRRVGDAARVLGFRVLPG